MYNAIVDAQLFRAASNFVSTETTRYYLNGVFIEKHKDGGVTMTSTDGHRMFCVYDPDAFMDYEGGFIAKLDKAALNACKPGRYDSFGRCIMFDYDGNAEIGIRQQSDDVDIAPKPIHKSYDVLIDGTFPDWRRIVPKFEEGQEVGAVGCFNADYVGSFGKIYADLGQSKKNSIQIVQDEPHNPALIRFYGLDNAFGVLMPMRQEIEAAVPEFV